MEIAASETPRRNGTVGVSLVIHIYPYNKYFWIGIGCLPSLSLRSPPNVFSLVIPPGPYLEDLVVWDQDVMSS